jgi:maleate isomerase
MHKDKEALAASALPDAPGRRNFVRGALTLAGAASLAPFGLTPAEAAPVGWRGVVGAILPAYRSGNLQDLIRILPDGVEIIPLYLGVMKGTKEELTDGIQAYDHMVQIFGEQKCDIIHPEGAPPFMILGREKETQLTDAWAKKYQTQVFTSSQNAVHAIKALHGTKVFGATYFPDKLNQIFQTYLASAGINVVEMHGLPDVPFDKVMEYPGELVYSFIKKNFLKSRNSPDCIYMLGSAWATLDIIDALEQDLHVPVIHPEPARAWEFQKRLNINQPKTGFGQLLATLPPLII